MLNKAESWGPVDKTNAKGRRSSLGGRVAVPMAQRLELAPEQGGVCGLQALVPPSLLRQNLIGSSYSDAAATPC
jgi:hypothetical protein